MSHFELNGCAAWLFNACIICIIGSLVIAAAVYLIYKITENIASLIVKAIGGWKVIFEYIRDREEFQEWKNQKDKNKGS